MTQNRLSSKDIFATPNLTNARMTSKNQTGHMWYTVPTSTLQGVTSTEAVRGLPHSSGILEKFEFPLWIKGISQDNTLQGMSAYSKNTMHFYPRSYAPGNYTFTGFARSQQDYQELAVFIRQHQQYMVAGNTATNSIPSKESGKAPQKNFVNLVIPSEGIFIRGYVANIMLIKKGVFDPVPEYQMEFVIAWQQNLVSNDAYISHIITGWYTGTNGDITGGPSPAGFAWALGTITPPSSSGSGGTGGSGSSGGNVGYTDPLGGVKGLQPQRTDQGVDYAAPVGSPIYAIGNATVITSSSSDSGWPGGGFISYKLTDGDHQGESIYVAEDIVPAVSAGPVTSGQVIAHFSSTPEGGGVNLPGIETGYLDPSTRDQACGHASFDGNNPTAAGLAFARFLKSLGTPVRDDPGAGSNHSPCGTS